MQSEEVKLAKIHAKTAHEAAEIELLKTILFNPVVELIGGVSILEYQARHGNIGQFANGAAITALDAIIAIQVLAPTLPAMTANNKTIIEGVTKLIPALTAAGLLIP